MMEYFVRKDSIVRKIWGSSDIILFIFGGASAEFALNKAVDWLYFTGKLPSDPIGRLFSTVAYARKIVFSKSDEAIAAIDTIHRIHGDVETRRGSHIPDWAYRDVLYMLIHYSIAAYELLQRDMTFAEKEEVCQVFFRVGKRMHLDNLPDNYTNWQKDRSKHMMMDLQKSDLTTDLFTQYRLHLGDFRYRLLIQAQMLVVPQRVKSLLGFNGFSFLLPMVPAYKFIRRLNMDRFIKQMLVPKTYRNKILALDIR